MPTNTEKSFRVGMITDELAAAGGIEESIITLVQALRSYGVDSVVLSCQAYPPDNQYALRLKASQIPTYIMPQCLLWLRDEAGRLADIINWSILILAWPITVGAILWQLFFKKRNIRQCLSSLLGRLRQLVKIRAVLKFGWRVFLLQWLKQHQSDIIHVHGYGGGVVPKWVVGAVVTSGLPVVYSEHGVPWPDLKNDPELCQDLSSVQQIIAISETTASALKECCGVTRSVHIIHHVVPDLQLQDISSPVKNLPKQSLVLGCVAMLRPPKGHIYWLRSMPKVLQHYPQARFAIAGDGPERQILEQETRSLSISNYVDFLGVVDHSNLAKLMLEWDIFVLPSLEEPLGIVVVEAMAAGLAIVATAAGGVLDLVEHNHSALLVPPGDSNSLAKAQLQLAGDPELRKRLGQNARKAYEQGSFTTQSVGSATFMVYREAMS